MDMLVLTVSGVVLLIVVLALWLGLSGGSSGTRPMRTCPVCGTELSMDERVYADQVEHSDRPHELTIKGCTHCYDREQA